MLLKIIYYPTNEDREWIKYAEDADILNVALFNITAKRWRKLNPDLAKKLILEIMHFVIREKNEIQ